MKEAVLYTGTFNPYHLGHLWQLERTYRAHPFDKVVIAIIMSNPKKPGITAWQDRLKLARLMFEDKNLPFEVEFRPIDYVQPNDLKVFVDEYLDGYRVIRTVASDAVVEFAQDKEYDFHEALLQFHYAVVIRPLVGKEELEQAIASLPKETAKRFSYEIVHVQTEDDIAATDIRNHPEAALEKGYITQSQFDFICEKRLYGG